MGALMIFSLIIGGLGAAGFGGAVSIFGLSPGLSSILIQAGKALLWGEVAKLTAPRTPAEQVQANISQATAPRIRGYGQQLLGGVRAFWEAESGTLHQVIMMHHGDVSQIVGFEVDGEAITIDGAGEVITGSVAGYMTIQSILSGDGGDYAALRAAFPTMWTDDHRLSGIATYYVRMREPDRSKLSRIYPRQDQTAISAIARLSKVVDPRSGVVGYSDLTGPCAMDYLTHADGYRIPMEWIDQVSFAAFTDVCDQDVLLKNGGAEKRWRIGGYYTLEDAPKDVMARILATADAQLYMTIDGKIGILGGQWQEPDVTTTASDILKLSLSDGYDEFTDFNVLKGKFTSPAHRYQAQECAELIDVLAQISQPERIETLTVDMCPSDSQMQRLLRAYKARKQPEFTGTILTNLVGLKARYPKGNGPHVIRVVDAESGFDAVFEVKSHSYSVVDKVCEITISSLENGYLWDAQTDQGPPPQPLADIPSPSSIIPPPVISAVSQQVVVVTGDFNAVRLVVQVADPGRQGLQLEAEYQRDIYPIEWQPMGARAGELRAISGVVDDAEPYSLRARWAGQDTWSAISSITVAANPTAPDPATALTRSIAAGTVTLSWVNGTAGYYKTRIYRSATNSFGAAALIKTVSGVSGQPSSTTNAPGVGTWYYWAVTINGSSVEATPAGSVSATI